MNTYRFPIRMISSVGALVLLGLLVANPTTASLRVQEEPTPRPTATASPYINAAPNQVIGGQDVTIVVTGAYWTTSGPGITIVWDRIEADRWLAGPFPPNPDGSFQMAVTVPAAWLTGGEHWVIALDNLGFNTSASVVVIAPTPTNTFTPSPTDTPTGSPTPRPTTTTPAPTATFTRTPTPTPSPSLRPITPATK